MDGTIGEIRMFAGSFAPRNWAFCAGQTIAIRSNTALFSILGTTYGGDGQTTFQLPNLQGNCVVGAGQGPGLEERTLGETGGSNTVTLITTEIPAHTHGLTFKGKAKASAALGSVSVPTAGVSLSRAKYVVGQTDVPILRFSSDAGNVVVNNTSVVPVQLNSQVSGGNNTPHDNRQPSLGMNFIICMFGLFPARN